MVIKCEMWSQLMHYRQLFAKKFYQHNIIPEGRKKEGGGEPNGDKVAGNN